MNGTITILPYGVLTPASFAAKGSRVSVRPSGPGFLMYRGDQIVGALIISAAPGAGSSDLTVLDAQTIKREYDVTEEAGQSGADLGQVLASTLGLGAPTLALENGPPLAAGILRASGWSPSEEVVEDMTTGQSVALAILENPESLSTLFQTPEVILDDAVAETEIMNEIVSDHNPPDEPELVQGEQT
jgi:hypothetical protein